MGYCEGHCTSECCEATIPEKYDFEETWEAASPAPAPSACASNCTDHGVTADEQEGDGLYGDADLWGDDDEPSEHGADLDTMFADPMGDMDMGDMAGMEDMNLDELMAQLQEMMKGMNMEGLEGLMGDMGDMDFSNLMGEGEEDHEEL